MLFPETIVVDGYTFDLLESAQYKAERICGADYRCIALGRQVGFRTAINTPQNEFIDVAARILRGDINKIVPPSKRNLNERQDP